MTWSTPLWEEARLHCRWMLHPLYHDLHVVRIGWFVAVQGGDPLADPANPFNYPRFVLAAASLGALNVPVAVLGLSIAAVLLASALAIVRDDEVLPPFLAALGVVAPPVLLMIERGNLDAVAFAFVAAALVLLRRNSASSFPVAIAACAMLFAAMLKLYPVVALPIAALFWRGRSRWWFIASFAAWIGWAVLNAREISLVMQKTTRGIEPAYGLALAGSRWYLEAIAPSRPVEQAQAWLSSTMRLSFGIFVAGLLVAAIAGLARGRAFPPLARPSRTISFVTGAAVFAGTFLLGTNWAYRLVFLLLCCPLLWELYRRGDLRWWSVCTLAGVAVVMFAPFHLPLALFFLVQGITWITAWLLVFGATAMVSQRFGRATAVPAAELAGN